ncbi:hypothetical protein OENI_400004 [Oenococcus oeni]|nr:hypothetical protein OENI_400004 [Oenococcus oeni]
MLKLIYHFIEIGLIKWNVASKGSQFLDQLELTINFLPLDLQKPVLEILIDVKKINSMMKLCGEKVMKLNNKMKKIVNISNCLQIITSVSQPISQKNVNKIEKNIGDLVKEINNLVPFVGPNLIQKEVSDYVINELGTNTRISLSKLMPLVTSLRKK